MPRTLKCRSAVVLLGVAAVAALAACQRTQEAPPPEIRPVRVIKIEKRASGDTVALTGTVQAQSEVNLAFRIDGRMITRKVNVGDTLKAGQLVAELDPQNEQSALQSARADLAAARGQLVEAQTNFERFRTLVARGAVSQAEFDRVTQIFRTAQAQVDSALAQQSIAENRLSYTRLVADAPGVVTAVGPKASAQASCHTSAFSWAWWLR